MSDVSLTLQCPDDLLSHQLRVTLYEEDGTAIVEVLLPRHNLRTRLRHAWRYLMGRPDCGVADILLSKEQVLLLKQWLVNNEAARLRRTS